MPDEFIDICFFNGAIRNTENEEIAHLLRKKSKTMVAFGSCAHLGGIPGLANMYDIEALCQRVFDTSPSLDETRGTRPKPITQMPEGEIKIPVLYDHVKHLADITKVEYFMPGCPPVVDQIWKVFQAALNSNLPPVGSVIGADEKTVCDICPREKGKPGFRITEFKRPHEIQLDPNKCFLTQGVICAGPVTRAGCGTPCLNGNMPCRGCYGPAEGITDQGAKLASFIGALIDTDDPERLPEILDSIVDPAGTFYRFGLAHSIMTKMKFG
jgi:F420-non-reducing hydrogenase small subunit